VASLGNNKGGYIICGLGTEKLQDSPHDYIKALDLAKKDEFYDEDQLIGIVGSNIYPKLDIKVAWYPYKNDKSFGLGVILISEQDESKKYFISKITEVEGGTGKTISVYLLESMMVLTGLLLKNCIDCRSVHQAICRNIIKAFQIKLKRLRV